MQAVGTAVICAAGTGSRLGLGIPKCLVSVDGRAIIDHQLDLLDDIDDIRVVVGYREDLVVRHVAARRPDAIFVRNPSFRTTTTLESLWAGARHVNGPFLGIDGDLIFEESGFRHFLSRCSDGAPLIGITPAGTEDGVYVSVDDEATPQCVTGFHRQPASAHEWCGPAYIETRHLTLLSGFVYEALEPNLPLPAVMIDVAEVDTQQDLDRARLLVKSWSDLESA